MKKYKIYYLPIGLIVFGIWTIVGSGFWMFPVGIGPLLIGLVLLIKRSAQSSQKNDGYRGNRMVSIILLTIATFFLVYILIWLLGYFGVIPILLR